MNKAKQLFFEKAELVGRTEKGGKKTVVSLW